MSKSKNLLGGVAAAFLIALPAVSAHASAIVDPSTGGSYDFTWLDLGPIDYIDFAPETDWSITLTSAQSFTIAAQDGYVPGDEFGLTLDGVNTAWDTAGYVGGYFNGVKTVMFSAGAHTFSLFTSALAPCCSSGSAYAQITPAVAAVPLPAGLPLLGAGLAGLAALRRKRRS